MMDWIDEALDDFATVKPWGFTKVPPEVRIDLRDAIDRHYAPIAEREKRLVEAARRMECLNDHYEEGSWHCSECKGRLSMLGQALAEYAAEPQGDEDGH